MTTLLTKHSTYRPASNAALMRSVNIVFALERVSECPVPVGYVRSSQDADNSDDSHDALHMASR